MWCIRNAVKLEKIGMATTIVCTSNFSSLIKATARAKGFPGMPLVVLSHPIAENNVNSIRKKADDSIDELIDVLTASTDRFSGQEESDTDFPVGKSL